jgi:hypothetical protein
MIMSLYDFDYKLTSNSPNTITAVGYFQILAGDVPFTYKKLMQTRNTNTYPNLNSAKIYDYTNYYYTIKAN